MKDRTKLLMLALHEFASAWILQAFEQETYEPGLTERGLARQLRKAYRLNRKQFLGYILSTL